MPKEYPVRNNEPKGQRIEHLYQDRLRQFTDNGHYRDLYLPSHYDYKRTDKDIEITAFSVPGRDRPLFKEALKLAAGRWEPKAKGDSFGPSWTTHWFKVKFAIPAGWKNVIFDWRMGAEGMLYLADGMPAAAFSDQSRNEWIVPDSFYDGAVHKVYIEVACLGITGNGGTMPPDDNRWFRLDTADLVEPNLEARALFVDFWILGDAARELDGGQWQKPAANVLANRIMDEWDADAPEESVARARKLVKSFLGPDIDSADVFAAGPGTTADTVFGIGNCHIDTAWLWPFAETRRKVARSWVSQLDLIERFPEYRFVASQAQQFKWLRQDHPDVFKRIQKAYKANEAFSPIGGTWVENDTNLPSGESIVRQFLLGQRFFETHFGKRSQVFWLPDTFGYSSQMPQLARLADMPNFMTQKLSWNNINNFPHSTFNWIALDGTQVLCHMPPANTYTAEAHFGDVMRSLTQNKSKDASYHSMLAYGHGDGGGGPTAEMIEKLRRCRGLTNSVQSNLPQVSLGKTVNEFYAQIAEATDNGASLPSWVGELYLEFHRGTYTTQALVKKSNRQAELGLRDLEFLASLASVVSPKYTYPLKDINELWEDVCLCQFHDVLPGSCIEMVYRDEVHPMHKNVLKKLEKLIRKALAALDVEPVAYGVSQRVYLNTLPWGRCSIVNSTALTNSTGQALVVASKSGLAKEISPTLLDTLIHADVDQESLVQSFAALGLKPIKKLPTASVSEVKPGVFVMKNDKLRVTVEGGLLTSVWDIDASREVLTGPGNQLVIFKDTPLSYQAWDTEVFSYDRKFKVEPGKVSILQNGPLRATIQVEQKISDKSSITSTISLDAFVPNLDDESVPTTSYVEFDCEVDWHETYKFLKVEFPVDVHADYASYETQFGITKRPTHYNTSWDMAKFEVCGHKFADLSEHGYGVSILNDSKYGWSIHGNLMRLSLLRSPKAPDANADMGLHQFRYALLPHSGGLSSDVVRTAYNFNHVMDAYYVPSEKLQYADDVLHSVTFKGDRNIIMSNIKRGEDDADVSLGELPKRKGQSLIVRLYESLGGRSRGFIESKLPLGKVYKCNLLEDNLEEVEVLVEADSDQVPIELRPFEVATFRLTLS